MQCPPALPHLDTAARTVSDDAESQSQSSYASQASLSYPASQASPTDSEASEAPQTPAPTSTESFGCPQAPSLLPAFDFRFPLPTSSESSSRTNHIPRVAIMHPYTRLLTKKTTGGAKRRKIWNHALEKSVFTAHEIATMGAPHRRTIYMASLEAHVDRLHAQLLGIGLYPIPFEKLEPFKGLNSKTAKSMVAGLQHDASHIKMKLLELERANHGLRNYLARGPSMVGQSSDGGAVRRHSVDSGYPRSYHVQPY